MASVAPTFTAGEARDAAFERLYRRYVQDVYRYTLALLRNPADAEDVTQTTFLNAYRVWARGERIEKPHNWLIRIAHNAARTKYARSLRRVPEVPLDEALNELSVPEDERPDVERVLAALAELPFNQRSALVMRELEGRSYSEIAQALGVSYSAVEALIFRARRSLRLSSNALRGLLFIPVPNSLSAFFEGSGAAVTGGSALAGTAVLVKAAAIVAAGAVAAGGGFKAIAAATTAGAPPASPPHAVRALGRAAAGAAHPARVGAPSGPASHAASGSGAVAQSHKGKGGAAATAVATAAHPSAAGARPISAQHPRGGGSSSASALVSTAANTVAAATAPVGRFTRSAPPALPVPAAAAAVSVPSVPPVQASSSTVSVPSTAPLTLPTLP